MSLPKLLLGLPLLASCSLAPVDTWFEREFDVAVPAGQNEAVKEEAIDLTDDPNVKDVENFIKEATISEATAEITAVADGNTAVTASAVVEVAPAAGEAAVFASEAQALPVAAGSKFTVTVPDADQKVIGDLILKKKLFTVRYKTTATFADGATNGTAAFHVKVRLHAVVTPGL
jgi:hypothetical protein